MLKFLLNWPQEKVSEANGYVAVNFFVSVNFCFCFVSNSLALPYPKTMEKSEKLPEIKKINYNRYVRNVSML